jgi:3-hydroxyisobutyrate dehydrogenase-like beta-hydroxyacid dehydrogenase
MTQPQTSDLLVCLLGLGEAGGSIGSDLIARGVAVRAWDPDPTRELPGAALTSTSEAAVRGSDAVLSINSATAALDAVHAALPALQPGQLYADLNSSSPSLKLELADVIASSGALFVDAALMDGVPGRGIGTRCLVSGPGADAFVRVFRPLGMPVEVVGDVPGDAAARKLLRSVFVKGLAAAAQEAVRAGQAAACEGWLRNEIAGMLAAADASLLDRLLNGSRLHAARRLREMQAVSELLRGLDVEPRVTASAISYLHELAQDEGVIVDEEAPSDVV